MVVTGILNFILGILMIMPYILFEDCVFGSLKGTREGRTWLVVSIIGIVFAIGVNVLMYFLYRKIRRDANKEVNKVVYWIVNIIVHFIPLIVTHILLFVSLRTNC